MFSGLFQTQYKKIMFEDIQYAIRYPEQFIIINTKPINEQSCLIKHTIPYNMEEKYINELLASYDLHSKKLFIYGKNALDISVEKKYKQLASLGFSEIYLYSGGMFEWMVLQDIYGNDEFPTTSKVLDILKYKPPRSFGGHYLTL